MGTEQRNPLICNSSIQENYPDSMEGNICRSHIGRKRKHSSQFKNLSNVSEDVSTGQWLVVQQPGAAAAQTCSRRKQELQHSNTASSSEWCCAVSCACHSSHQLGHTAFSGSPSCQLSHSVIDIRNLNYLVLWKLIVLNQIWPNHLRTEFFHKGNSILLTAVSLSPKYAVLMLLLTSKIPEFKMKKKKTNRPYYPLI